MTEKIKKLALFTALIFATSHIGVFAQTDLKLEGKTAVLFDEKLEKIIYDKNKDTRRLPASVTKLMTVLVAFDIIEKENIPMDTRLVVSQKAAATGGVSINLKEGDELSLEDIISAIVVCSANDASVVLAEYLSGSEEEFIKLMNQKALQMGLENTNFVSCNGLTQNSNHYTTASDMGKVALELIREEEIFKYSALPKKEITRYIKNKETGEEITKKFTIRSTNQLLGVYEGIDGLKTGWVGDSSGYCFVGTAQREDTRLISVTMGATEKYGNFRDTVKLMDYGFNNFRYHMLMKKNQEIGKSQVLQGTKKSSGQLSEDVVVFTDSNKENYILKNTMYTVCAPVKKGDITGKADLFYKNSKVKEYAVTASENIYQLPLGNRKIQGSLIEKLKGE